MLDLSYAIFFILDERTVECIYDGTRGKLTIDNAVCHELYDSNEKRINETEFGMIASCIQGTDNSPRYAWYALRGLSGCLHDLYDIRASV